MKFKKLLSIVVSVALCVLLLPTFALADGETEGQTETTAQEQPAAETAPAAESTPPAAENTQPAAEPAPVVNDNPQPNAEDTPAASEGEQPTDESAASPSSDGQVAATGEQASSGNSSANAQNEGGSSAVSGDNANTPTNSDEAENVEAETATSSAAPVAKTAKKLGAPLRAPASTPLTEATLNFTPPRAGQSTSDVSAISCFTVPSGAGYSVEEGMMFDHTRWITDFSANETYTGTFEAGNTYYAEVVVVSGTDTIAVTAGGFDFDTNLVVNGAWMIRQNGAAITYGLPEGGYGATTYITAVVSFTPTAATTPRVWFEATTGGSIEASYATGGGSSSLTTVPAGNKSELANMFYGYSPASGETIELTAKPASGYRFIGWYKAWNSTNPVAVSTSATYSYTVPTAGETLTAAFKSEVRDSYIDNTVDNSKSYVTGVVYLAGEVGTEEGYNPEKTVYTNEASVTYSTPKPPTVQDMIDAAYTQVNNLAKACKEKGDRGEFNMSTNESTGKVWDDREYTSYTWDGTKWDDGNGNTYSMTVSGNHSPNIGDRLHIASGDYGKYTYYRVEANGWVERDHTHTLVKTDKVEPTCTTAGTEAYWTCSECNKMFSDEAGTKEITAPVEIAATGHDWGEWTETKAPTCTEIGTEERVCKHDASHKETREVAATGHKWDEGVVTKEPTCTETGEKTFTCQNDSNHIKIEEVAALGHSWGAWEVVKEATETEDGLEQRTCSRCGEVETRVVPHLVVEYRNTEGDGTSWEKGSSSTADFVFKRSINDSTSFSHFLGIQVDGTDVDAANYTAESGSVIVKLKPAYLETLAEGKHTITALFDDGNNPSATFYITAKKVPVQAAPAKASGPTKPTTPGKASDPTKSTTPATSDVISHTHITNIVLIALCALLLAVRARRRA